MVLKQKERGEGNKKTEGGGVKRLLNYPVKALGMDAVKTPACSCSCSNACVGFTPSLGLGGCPLSFLLVWFVLLHPGWFGGCW